MVYTKYIKRGRKLHGPYFYESIRDSGGHVKNIYLGKALSQGQLLEVLKKKCPGNKYIFSQLTKLYSAEPALVESSPSLFSSSSASSASSSPPTSSSNSSSSFSTLLDKTFGRRRQFLTEQKSPQASHPLPHASRDLASRKPIGKEDSLTDRSSPSFSSPQSSSSSVSSSPPSSSHNKFFTTIDSHHAPKRRPFKVITQPQTILAVVMLLALVGSLFFFQPSETPTGYVILQDHDSIDIKETFTLPLSTAISSTALVTWKGESYSVHAISQEAGEIQDVLIDVSSLDLRAEGEGLFQLEIFLFDRDANIVASKSYDIVVGNAEPQLTKGKFVDLSIADTLAVDLKEYFYDVSPLSYVTESSENIEAELYGSILTLSVIEEYGEKEPEIISVAAYNGRERAILQFAVYFDKKLLEEKLLEKETEEQRERETDKDAGSSSKDKDKPKRDETKEEKDVRDDLEKQLRKNDNIGAEDIQVTALNINPDSTVSVRIDLAQKAELQLDGITDMAQLENISYTEQFTDILGRYDSYPVVAVNHLDIADATIILPRLSAQETQRVVRCEDWDFADNSCKGIWEGTSLAFEENATHVWFTVPHFTAYTVTRYANQSTNVAYYDHDMNFGSDQRLTHPNSITPAVEFDNTFNLNCPINNTEPTCDDLTYSDIATDDTTYGYSAPFAKVMISPGSSETARGFLRFNFEIPEDPAYITEINFTYVGCVNTYTRNDYSGGTVRGTGGLGIYVYNFTNGNYFSLNSPTFPGGSGLCTPATNKVSMPSDTYDLSEFINTTSSSMNLLVYDYSAAYLQNPYNINGCTPGLTQPVCVMAVGSGTGCGWCPAMIGAECIENAACSKGCPGGCSATTSYDPTDLFYAWDNITSDYVELKVYGDIPDLTPPTITLNSPANMSFSYLSEVNLSYTPNDADSGIDYCTLFINDDSNVTDIVIVEGVANNFTVTGLNGTYTWNIECTDDSAGANAANSSQYTLIAQVYPYMMLYDQVNSATLHVELADIDGDGDEDLFEQNDNQNFSIYRNNGTGGFIWHQNLSVLAKTFGMFAVFDSDNDGDIDLLAYDGTPTAERLVLYDNNGTGNFTIQSTKSIATVQSTAMKAGDFNHDGYMDVVIIDSGTIPPTIRTYLYNSSASNFYLFASLSTNFAYPTTYGLDAADLDNDTDIDLVRIARGAAYNIVTYTNDGDGTFTEGPFSGSVGAVYSQVVLAEVNGDGYPDLFAIDPAGAVYLHFYNGTGYGSSPNASYTSLTGSPNTIDTGDFNNDGFYDVMIGTTTAKKNMLLTVNSTYSFISVWNSTDTPNTKDVAIADIDDDGDLDTVFGNYDGNTTIYTNTQAGQAASTVPSAPSSGFSSAWGAGYLNLSWGSGSDTQTTDPDRLYYNIRVGTTTAGNDVVSGYYGTPIRGYAMNRRDVRLNVSNSTYYWSVQTIDSAFMNSSWSAEQRWPPITNVAPDTPVLTLNSTFGTNFSNEDLNCVATITDPDDDNLNVTVRWYNSTVLWLTQTFNSNYANGTLFNATLGDGNTTAGEIWYCSVQLNDTMFTSGWGNSSNLTIRDGTALTNCTNITASGNYYLMNPINNAANTCMRITADHVLLDCQANQIDGVSTGSGIYLDGVSASDRVTNVTVRNCPVQEFSDGIMVEYANESFLFNCSAANPADDGIYLYYAVNNTLRNVTATDDGTGDDGLYAQESDYNILSRIRITGYSGTSDVGLKFETSDGNNITGMNLSGNYYGTSFTNCLGTRVEHSVITDNSYHGFYWYSASVIGNKHSVINNITVSGHTSQSDSSGLYLANEFQNNNLTNITAFDNNYGIYITGSITYPAENNRFSRMMLTNNSAAGLYVSSSSSSDNVFSDNFFNNTFNAFVEIGADNAWNVSNLTGTNIIGGPRIGGNYWSNYPFNDTNGDGYGEYRHHVDGANFDYLPLVDVTNNGTMPMYNLSECRAIFLPGSYVLNNSVSNHLGTCIPIVVSDVELDCQNNQIDGQDVSAAIYTPGSASSVLTNITMRNCRLNDFLLNLYMSYTDSSFVYNVSSTSSLQYGFSIENSDYNRMDNLTAATSADDGFYIQSITYSNLSNLTSYSNTDDGIYMYGGGNDYNNFTDISSTLQSGSADMGLRFEGTSGNSASYNTFTNINLSGNNYGAWLTYCTNNYFRNITVSANGQYGIYFTVGATRNFIRNITAYGQTSAGAVYLANSYNNITDGTIHDNNFGIVLNSATYSYITGLAVFDNTAGFNTTSTSTDNNRIYNNYFNNTDGGRDSNIEFVSGADNYWNASLRTGLNVMGGEWLGGNYWSNGTGGFSDTCDDSSPLNGICDAVFNATGRDGIDIDRLPLALLTGSHFPLLDVHAPANDSYTDDDPVIFFYNVTDLESGIENCSLMIDGIANQTNTTVTETAWQNFSVSGLSGTYTWYIECYDNSTAYRKTTSGPYNLYTRIYPWLFLYDQVNSPTIQVEMGDLNNDSLPDLVELNENQALSVYLNNGTGGMDWHWNTTPITFGPMYSESVGVFDFDNDRDLDIIVTNGTMDMLSRQVLIYANNGTANFTLNRTMSLVSGVTYPGGPFKHADLNGDGSIDLVFFAQICLLGVCPPDYASIWTYLYNSSSGTYDYFDMLTIDPSYDIDLAEMEGDQDLDIVLSSAGRLSILNNSGNGTFLASSPVAIAQTLEHIRLAEINGDGKLDLFGSFQKYVYIYLYNGTQYSYVSNASIDTTFNPIATLDIGDYNNDGLYDLVVGTQSAKNALLLVNATFAFTQQWNSTDTPDTRDLAIADIDGDGDLDIVFGNYDGNTTIYKNTMATSSFHTVPLAPTTFTTSYTNSRLNITWGNGSDTQTGTSRLYYNLRVGNYSGGDNIVSHYHGTPLTGYAKNRQNISLNVSDYGSTFYWCVETIDSTFRNSSCSAEQQYPIANAPPDTPAVTINSTYGTNYTNENLNCVATILDPDNDTMNVTVRWYNNTVLWLTESYNNNYANGTQFNASLGHPNTTTLEIWYCSLLLNDSSLVSGWGNSSNLTITPFYINLTINKTYSPTIVIAGEATSMTATAMFKINSTVNNIIWFNFTDEISYGFIAPSLSDVTVYHFNFSDSSLYDITSKVNITVVQGNGTNLSKIEVLGNATYIGYDLRVNDSIRLDYNFTTDQLNVDEQRNITTYAFVFDTIDGNSSTNLTTNITAVNTYLKGYKIVQSNPSYPANVTVLIYMQAVGGTFTGILFSDYLPDAITTAADLNSLSVRYYNASDSSYADLSNNSDFQIYGPTLATLPDGLPASLFYWNLSVDSPVEWDNNIYANDSIIVNYTVTLLGGGQWVLPTIIGGWDPEYQKHIQTEIYTSHSVPSFDVVLDVITPKVEPGGLVKGVLRMLNVGGPKAKVDVFINYAIKTMAGALITERSQTIAVVEKKEVALELPTPQSIEPGLYTFETFVTYTKREAMSTGNFEVLGMKKKESALDMNYGIWLVVAMNIIILVVVMVRTRKKKEIPKV